MSRRSVKPPKTLKDYDVRYEDDGSGRQTRAKPAVSVVFTEDGVRKTVNSRKFCQLTEADGSCPDPNVVYEGQKLYCWHTPSKATFPCIVLRVEWKDDCHDEVSCKRKLVMDKGEKSEGKQKPPKKKKKLSTIQMEIEREDDGLFLETYKDTSNELVYEPDHSLTRTCSNSLDLQDAIADCQSKPFRSISTDAAAFGDEGFWKEFKAQGELLKDLKVRVDDIYDILDKKQRKQVVHDKSLKPSFSSTSLQSTPLQTTPGQSPSPSLDQPLHTSCNELPPSGPCYTFADSSGDRVYVGSKLLAVTAPYLAVKLVSDKARDRGQLARGLLDVLVNKETQAKSSVSGSATKAAIDPQIIHAIRDAALQQFPLQTGESQHQVYQKITTTLSDKCRFLTRHHKRQ